jgi:flagellar protein FlgJ
MHGAEGISSPATLSFPLAARPGATVKGSADARLKDTAKEMEATFLSMLLKEMRQTLEPDGGLFPGDSGDVHGGLFDMYLGRHLADAGGVGMAAALIRQMQAGTPKTTSTDAPARLTPAVNGSTRSAPGA